VIEIGVSGWLSETAEQIVDFSMILPEELKYVHAGDLPGYFATTHSGTLPAHSLGLVRDQGSGRPEAHAGHLPWANLSKATRLRGRASAKCRQGSTRIQMLGLHCSLAPLPLFLLTVGAVSRPL